MLNGINVLQGYIANDIKVKQNDRNKNFISFLLKVKDGYYNENDEYVKRYQSIPFIAYGKLAERLERKTVKGQSVMIQYKVVSVKDNDGYLIPLLVARNFQTLEAPEQVKERQKLFDQNQDADIPVDEELQISKTASDLESYYYYGDED